MKKFLRVAITNAGDRGLKIRKIQTRTRVYHSYKKLLSSMEFDQNNKSETLQNNHIIPILTYAEETTTLTQKDINEHLIAEQF